MSRYSIHILIFVAGLVCGGILTAITISAVDPNELEIPPTEGADSLVDLPFGETDVAQHIQRDPADIVDSRTKSPSKMAPVAITTSGHVTPEIPESYRETIGPAI
ncbi:MAG: hypothetical protein WBM34_14250, partial [Woeseiaceae bacterium]